MPKERCGIAVVLAILAAASIAAAAILLAMFSLGSKDYKPVKTTVHDSSLVVTRFAITQGTNHTIYRGSPLLARFNQALIHFGLSAVGDARQLTRTTAKDSAMMCIGYAHPASPLGLKPGSVAALFTDTRGQTVLFLEEHTFMLDPKNNSCLTIWNLPALLTNYAGCELHLLTKPDNKKLVTFQL